jgi:hypothetical protein
MRNNLIKKIIQTTAILGCLTVFATIGKAQITNRLRFETSFDFNIKNQKFPAGKYTIERLNQFDPQTLVLRAVNGQMSLIMVGLLINEGEFSDNGKIVFEHIKEDYFLSKILPGSYLNGYEIWLNKEEK